jgi:hypothetical protein
MPDTNIALDASRPADPARARRGAAQERLATEFERLSAAYDLAYRRHDAFMEAGHIFADALTDAFAEYLRCPRGAVAFQPEDADIREVGLMLFIPEQAIKLRADGWFGFRITLRLGLRRHVSFPLAFMRNGESAWTVKLTGTSARFEIGESLDGADAAFEAWVDLATAGLVTALDGLIPEGDAAAGFEVDFVRRDR